MQRTTRIPAPQARYWEIDTARGLAVVLMIFFHLMWDLGYVGLSAISVFTPGWQLFARGIGSTFTFLLGLSIAVRSAQPRNPHAPWLMTMLRRGLIIFGYGMLVTLATYLAVGNEFVVFGILHMQGIALMLAALAVRLPSWLNAALGLAMIGVGLWLNTLTVPYPWLIWLGLTEQGRTMVDYYPLLPWAGFALLGVAFGVLAYRGRVPQIQSSSISTRAPIRALRFLGKHSLPIYLLHQPLLLGALSLWVWLAR